MIDKEARQKAASVLQLLLDEGITNYRLEDCWPQETEDMAVNAIQEQLWLLYDAPTSTRIVYCCPG